MGSLKHNESESLIESQRPYGDRAYVSEVGKDENDRMVKIERDESGSVVSTVPYDAMAYSRMKHGDPEAIKDAAQEVFVRIITDDSIMKSLLENEVVITNSTRKVPTASFTIMKVLVEEFLNPYLKRVGASTIEWIKSERKGGLHAEDYSASRFEERERIMKERQPFFSEFSLRKLEGKKVILFDDLVATGSYEKNQRELLNDSGIRNEDIIPLYWVQMEKEASKNPKFEAEINYAGVKSLNDLLDFFYDPRLVINARAVKYIFSVRNPETKEIDGEKAEELKSFFKSLGEVPSNEKKQENGRDTLIKLYEAMKSEDGYSSMERFSDGFKILDEYLLELDIHPRKSSFSTKIINSKEDADPEEARMYSLMKYGDPKAVRFWAKKMTDHIMSDPEMVSLFKENKFVITSSAFGSVQTAANAIASEVTYMLREKGIRVEKVKIDRAGGFAATNYGQMGHEQRERLAKARKISLSDVARGKMENAVVLVIDDVKVTGTHEKMIDGLLESTGAKKYMFGYMIGFGPDISKNEPEAEEWLNRNAVGYIGDLLPIFAGDNASPTLNARTLKFILDADPERELSHKEKLENLESFLMSAGNSVLYDIYIHATSADAYQLMPKFRPGFQVLRRVMVKRCLINEEALNCDEKSLTLHNATIDESDNFRSMENGEDLNEIAERYSRMKFGDVEEIRFFGKELAQKIITRIKTDLSFAEMFRSAKEKGEYIYAIAPGSRNVQSSSNYLLEDVIERVNAYLTMEGLPTIIIKNVTRLGSTNVNYAELSAEERAGIESRTTEPLIPVAELQEFPIHVLFIDDIEITGTTLEKTRRECTQAGALSFHSIFGMKINPVVAHERPEIEDLCNKVVIKGDLNEDVLRIINHEDFRPVQRLIRIVLDPEKTGELRDFLKSTEEKGLIKLYRSALSNDYLWIRDGFYRASLEILIEEMKDRSLINEEGLLVK